MIDGSSIGRMLAEQAQREATQAVERLEYLVASAYTVEQLTVCVADALNAGWRPEGGICYDGDKYLQAMVR